MRRIVSILVAVTFCFNVLASFYYVSASETVNVLDNFVDCDTLVVGNTADETTMNQIDSDNLFYNIELFPVIEQRRREINEPFSVRFKLSEAHINATLTYESEGFTVAKVAEYGQQTECQYYDVLLIYDGIQEKPYFSLKISTDSGVIVCATIYGYVSENGLFLSDGSFESAEDASNYYLVETGVLSMDEYRDVLQQK